MALMEWSQRPPALVRLRREEDALRLAVGGRLSKTILDLVQGQTAMNELNMLRLGHGIDS